MHDYAGSIEYRGKEYKIVFNLNVMEAIQKEYGTLEAWGNLTDGTNTNSDGEKNANPTPGEVDAAAVIFGFTEMINEGIDMDNDENGTSNPLLSRKQVGRMISEIGLQNAAEAMNETVVESSKVPAKNG